MNLPNYLLTRDLVNLDIEIIQNGTTYRYLDLMLMVDNWHRTFEELQLKSGDPILYLNPMSIEMIALLLASGEYGLVFYNIHRLFLGTGDSYGKELLFGKEVEPTLFYTYVDEAIHSLPLEWQSNTCHVTDLSRPTVRRAYSPNSTDLMIVALSSGSSGKVRRIHHHHNSTLFTSYTLADVLFQPGDVFLTTPSILHLSAFISTTLPMLMVGGKIILGLGDWEQYMDLIEQHRPNRLIVTPTVVEQYLKDSTRWNQMEMSFVDSVITGGQALCEEFARDLLESKDIGSIYNMYGTTECTNIAYEVIRREDLDPFDEVQCRFSNIIPHVDITIDDRGEVLFKTPYIYQEPGVRTDGFLPVGDYGKIDDGILHVAERPDRYRRIEETLVNLTLMEKVILNYLSPIHLHIKGTRVFVDDQRLYLLIDSPMFVIHLGELNRLIRQRFSMALEITAYGFASPEVLPGAIKKTWVEDAMYCIFNDEITG